MPLTYWDAVPRRDRARARRTSQNWQLAARPRSTTSPPTTGRRPVQHFWSLSVEEQFYLVWPLLILLAAARPPRGRARPARRAAPSAIGALDRRQPRLLARPTRRPTRPPRTSSRRRARGSSAPAACSRCSRQRERSPGRARRAVAGSAWPRSSSRPLAFYATRRRSRAAAALLPVARRARRDRGGRADAPLGADAARSSSRRSSSSATSPTRSTCGTGRCSSSRRSSSATPVAPGARCILVAHAPRWPGCRSVLVEDPVRARHASSGRAGARAGRSRSPRRGTALVLRRRRSAHAHVAGAELRDGRARPAAVAGRAARAASAPPRATRAAAVRQPEAAHDGRADAGRRRASAPNAPATSIERAAACSVCAFGVAARRRPTATIALVGDSHAVALARRRSTSWRRAQRLARRSRSRTRAARSRRRARDLPSRRARECAQWKRECRGGSPRHPEVDTRLRRRASPAAASSRQPGGRQRLAAAGRRLPGGLERAAADGQARRRHPRHAEDARRRRRLRAARDGRAPRAPAGACARAARACALEPRPGGRRRAARRAPARASSTSRASSATAAAAPRSSAARSSTRTSHHLTTVFAADARPVPARRVQPLA